MAEVRSLASVTAEDVRALVRVADPAAITPTRIGGGPHSVWRLGDGRVLRIAHPALSDRLLAHGLVIAEILADRVPLVRPAHRGVLRARELRATLWVEEIASGPLDWHSVGRSVRALQEAGTAVVAEAPVLMRATTDVFDLEAARRRIATLGARGALSVAETRALLRWTRRMAATVDRWAAAPIVLAHDDLWPTNIIQTARGAVLMHPDAVAWGVPAYDAAFVHRAAARGLAAAADVDAFAAGWGGAMPSEAEAEELARFHRLRWLASAAERRDQPEVAARIAAEMGHWL